jgi:hypothetical protein
MRSPAAISEHVRRGAVDWLLENAGEIEIEEVDAASTWLRVVRLELIKVHCLINPA